MSDLRFLDEMIKRWRFRVAEPKVPIHSRVLDIGTADGSWLSYLGSRIQPSVGIDPEASERTTPEGHRILKCTLESLPVNESFDCVTALAVLEHLTLDELGRFGEQLFSHTTDNATLVVTVPSPAVDRILDVAIKLRLLNGMEADEHHGLEVNEIPRVLGESGWSVGSARRFELRLNNLFTFVRSNGTGHSRSR